jgi:hypothetical protein
VQSPCNPLIEDYTEIFHMIDKEDIPSFQCKMSLRRPKSVKKVDSVSLIFIDIYIQALTPRLNSTETSQQLSECRDLDRQQVSAAYHLYTYIYCTRLGRGRDLTAPLDVYPMA